MMKKLKLIIISSLLLLAPFVLADTVYFKWSYSDPIQYFMIYTGTEQHIGQNAFVIPPTARQAGVEVPRDHYAWITAVNDNGVESWPSNAIQYKPVTVELVIQQSKDLTEWGGRIGVFVFRVPAELVGNVQQRLNITKTHVEVSAWGQKFSVPIPTDVGKKFYRSYVAVSSI